MKRRISSLLCLIVLGPVVPLYLLRAMAQGIVDGLDWMTEGRAWCRPFLTASERIERALGTDADAEREAWRRRMGFSIVTKKDDL